MAEHLPPNPLAHGEHQHAHGGVGKYVMVFIALCVLTAISFAVGNSQSLRQNSPGTMWAMMMAVSCAKAMLVILFFMHMLWEANWKYVLTIPASMMSIFLLLMLVPDIGRRTAKYAEERWLFAAEPRPTTPLTERDPDAQADAEHADHAPAQSIDSGALAAAAAVSVRDVSYAYGPRQALQNMSLEIGAGELFAVLGPNGGGKTTLFRLLSTLIPLSRGSVSILGHDLASQTQRIRRSIGVVFQAPSLDRKLTVAENIRLQARLYGLSGRDLDRRLDELLDHFAIRDRANDLVERLSGGLRRRVELAKGMIHQPELLLLDEPTTGLDPAARSDVWQYLRNLRESRGTTILFTTHYLDEADAADRLAILSAGRLVALGAPGELRAAVGGDSITIETDEPAALASAIQDRLGQAAKVVDGAVRLEAQGGHLLIARIVEAFPGRLNAIRLGKPTLDDVFIAKTGHRFWDQRREGAAP